MVVVEALAAVDVSSSIEVECSSWSEGHGELDGVACRGNEVVCGLMPGWRWHAECCGARRWRWTQRRAHARGGDGRRATWPCPKVAMDARVA
jgi:hypothetical protein